ncbi:hypothetical protein BESB_050670 [Besnoitia besnoiti]|uniref:NAD(P)-binding domain-containing protein n=1 Tax=Besnoitia besnoiti TaxID=94643 RepID=A0A2A9MFU1_BESBE|nr:hypothetical protein BESB_050670 [Besnoitia besnoiti]PFH36875.1 hypothetical protein BESB_050670 [Besnoitia besnoiti]
MEQRGGGTCAAGSEAARDTSEAMAVAAGPQTHSLTASRLEPAPADTRRASSEEDAAAGALRVSALRDSPASAVSPQLSPRHVRNPGGEEELAQLLSHTLRPKSLRVLVAGCGSQLGRLVFQRLLHIEQESGRRWLHVTGLASNTAARTALMKEEPQLCRSDIAVCDVRKEAAVREVFGIARASRPATSPSHASAAAKQEELYRHAWLRYQQVRLHAKRALLAATAGPERGKLAAQYKSRLWEIEQRLLTIQPSESLFDAVVICISSHFAPVRLAPPLAAASLAGGSDPGQTELQTRGCSPLRMLRAGQGSRTQFAGKRAGKDAQAPGRYKSGDLRLVARDGTLPRDGFAEKPAARAARGSPAQSDLRKANALSAEVNSARAHSPLHDRQAQDAHRLDGGQKESPHPHGAGGAFCAPPSNTSPFAAGGAKRFTSCFGCLPGGLLPKNPAAQEARRRRLTLVEPREGAADAANAASPLAEEDERTQVETAPASDTASEDGSPDGGTAWNRKRESLVPLQAQHACVHQEGLKGKPAEPGEAASCKMSTDTTERGAADASRCRLPQELVYDYVGGYPREIDWLGQKNIMDAAKESSAMHVILCSMMGGTDPNHQLNQRGRHRSKFRRGQVGGDLLLWKRRSERYLVKSGISYTIVHPPGELSDGPEGSDLVVGVNDVLDSVPGQTISRNDVAKILVHALTDPAYLDQSFDVSGASTRQTESKDALPQETLRMWTLMSQLMDAKYDYRSSGADQLLADQEQAEEHRAAFRQLVVETARQRTLRRR